jgi:BlaI family penicillinase repressor
MSKKLQQPSEAEIEILQELWDSVPMTVREVHEKLRLKKKVGYTTTLKQMQRMLEKGFVKREDGEKGHYYSALIKEEETKGQIFDKMIDTLFKGSAMDMIMHALGRNDTNEEELKQLKEWLDNKEKDK